MSEFICDTNCNKLITNNDVPAIVIKDTRDDIDRCGPMPNCSSMDTSLSSISDSNSELAPGIENDIENPQDSIFMEKHVAQLFDSSIEIGADDKQKFGALCQTLSGRQMFAKYVDNQRNQSKQVDETTFYKLSHSFALVLFECFEADDFNPAKTLMNMAFTYYHIPEFVAWRFQSATEPVELESPDMNDFVQYLSDSDPEDGKNDEAKRSKIFGINIKRKSKSVNTSKLSFWKSANIWFNKEINLYKDKINEHFGDEEDRCMEDHKGEISDEDISSPSDESCSSISDKSKDGTKELLEKQTTHVGERIYLYSALKHQVIWKSLRFWNAAFFDSVNAERKTHYSRLRWNSLTKEEKDIANEEICNITFGQLGAFITTMKYLGLGQRTCSEFLKKQSIIGNLSKEFYQMLKLQIERPLTENT